MGIIGGLLVTVYQLNVAMGVYLNDVMSELTYGDVLSGLGKTVFFAYFIAIIACYNGLNARGGADGVGRATTNTVVGASISILISDYFLTKLFSSSSSRELPLRNQRAHQELRRARHPRSTELRDSSAASVWSSSDARAAARA